MVQRKIPHCFSPVANVKGLYITSPAPVKLISFLVMCVVLIVCVQARCRDERTKTMYRQEREERPVRTVTGPELGT